MASLSQPLSLRLRRLRFPTSSTFCDFQGYRQTSGHFCHDALPSPRSFDKLTITHRDPPYSPPEDNCQDDCFPKFSNIANKWPQTPYPELMLNILFEEWFPNQPFGIKSHRTSGTPVPETPRFLQLRTWRRNTHRKASAASSSNSSLGSQLLKP